MKYLKKFNEAKVTILSKSPEHIKYRNKYVASWENVEFFYYDDNGDYSPVSVDFTPAEQAEIDVQKKVSWEDYKTIKAAKAKAKDRSNKLSK